MTLENDNSIAISVRKRHHLKKCVLYLQTDLFPPPHCLNRNKVSHFILEMWVFKEKSRVEEPCQWFLLQPAAHQTELKSGKKKMEIVRRTACTDLTSWLPTAGCYMGCRLALCAGCVCIWDEVNRCCALCHTANVLSSGRSRGSCHLGLILLRKSYFYFLWWKE